MPSVVSAVGGLVGCGVGCSSLFWIIFGSVWRFGTMGSLCTRDALTPITENQTVDAYNTQVASETAMWGLQVQSGAFMKTWLIITYCLMGLKLLGCIAGLIFKPSMG